MIACEGKKGEKKGRETGARTETGECKSFEKRRLGERKEPSQAENSTRDVSAYPLSGEDDAVAHDVAWALQPRNPRPLALLLTRGGWSGGHDKGLDLPARSSDGAACAVHHPPWNAFAEDPADAILPHGSIHDAEGDSTTASWRVSRRRGSSWKCERHRTSVKARARARVRVESCGAEAVRKVHFGKAVSRVDREDTPNRG